MINSINALYAQKQSLTESKYSGVNFANLKNDSANLLNSLKEFSQAKYELERQKTLKGVGIDIDTTDAENKVKTLYETIKNADPQMLTDLGIDPSSQESVLSTIENMDPEIIATLEIEKQQALNDLMGVAYSDDLLIVMKADADFSQIQAQIDNLKEGQTITFNGDVQFTDENGKTTTKSSVISGQRIDGEIHYYAEFEDGKR